MNAQINPDEVIDRQWIINSDEGKEFNIQQIGIDLYPMGKNILILQGDFRNILLQQKICCPPMVYAELKVRSSYSRMGVFISAGIYDPGYGWDNEKQQPDYAPLGCTVYNMGDVALDLSSDKAICQIVFYHADPSSVYKGHYNSTKSIESKLKK